MSSVPPPDVEMSSMLALSWVSLGGAADAGHDSDDLARVVLGALMRFGSPPGRWDFSSFNHDASPSDTEAFFSSKRRRRCRPARPNVAAPVASPSTGEGHPAAAVASECAASDSGVGVNDADDGGEDHLGAAPVDGSMPALGVVVEDKKGIKALSNGNGSSKELRNGKGHGAVPHKRGRRTSFKKLE